MIVREINVKMAAPVSMASIRTVAVARQIIPANIVNRMSMNVPSCHRCVRMEQLAPIHLVPIRAYVSMVGMARIAVRISTTVPQHPV